MMKKGLFQEESESAKALALPDLEYRTMIRQTLTEVINLADADKTTVMLPSPDGRWERLPGFFFHVSYEIFIQMDGGCRFRFPGQELVLRPGSLMIVPPGMPHHERSFSLHGKPFRNLLMTLDENHLTVHIAESRVRGENRAIPEPVYPEKVNSIRKRLYVGLAEAAEQLGSDERIESVMRRLRLVQALLAMVREDLGEPVATGVAEDDANREHYRVAMVKAIVYRSIMADSPAVAELAERVGCSPNYLSWLFRRETGETLKGYINRTRMDHARSLLLTTTRSIGEIAWMCGFKDAAYFARLFERYCGDKPYEYRLRLRGSGYGQALTDL